MNRTSVVVFFLLFVVDFPTEGTTDTAMSDELKIQIEPPETATSTADYLPSIMSISSQLSVLVGDSVVLPCRVDHLRHYVVIWKRGRTRTLFAGSLKVDSDKKFGLTDRTFLQIERVTPEYAGEYVCQVNTKPPVELVHHLYVLVAPTLTLDPKDGHVIVNEGDPAMARCIAEGYPEPIITWRAKKGVLPGGLKEKQGSVLTIAYAAEEHTGSYECQADNGVGDPATAVVRIKVLYAPILEVSPSWRHAGRGSSVEFSCSAASEPPAVLSWTRVPDKDISGDNHFSFHNVIKASREHLVMQIRHITTEYLGTYACSARNSLGSVYKTVEVSGLAEPVIFKSNVTGDETTSFFLIWTVTSYTPIIEYLLRIRVQKNKESSSQSAPWIDVMIPVEMRQSVLHSHNYNITGLQPGTSYEVVMQARNNYGWNHPSDTFTFSTGGGEAQSDDWEKSTTGESTSQPVFATDMALQIANIESGNDTPSTANVFLQSVTSLATILLILRFLS